MSHFRPIAVCLLGLAAVAPTASAVDRSADLVAAMRQAGWDDTAVEFLDWVEKSPLASDAFRAQIPFERAVCLASQARRSRNRDERNRLLSRAADDFQKFAQGDLDSPAALDALRQSANLHAEQAVAALGDVDRLPAQATSQRDAARNAARQKFKLATDVAQQVLDLCKKRLAALPKPSALEGDAESAALRDGLRTKQVEARFLMALISFEEARTHASGSREYGAALDRASQQFGELHEQYRDTVVGASSRFYQGRCAQEKREYQKALGCYEDLIRMRGGADEFRSWTARAHRRRAECLLAQGNVDEAIRDCKQWLDESRPAERQRPEWLEVAFQLATAYRAKLNESDAEGPQARNLESEARELLRQVAENPNEFQREARASLTSLGRRTRAVGEVKTFEDAFTAGREAFEQMRSLQAAVELARDNNPDEVDNLQAQVAECRKDALISLEQALNLADRESPLEQLNASRYYLCWLYWQNGRIDEAAVLGAYLASRYPESEYAASAAQVGLASLEKLYNETRKAGSAAPANGSTFASRELSALAQLVATRWPSADQAASAVNVLIGIKLREKQLDEAEKLLDRLPAESRAAAELRLGSALWTQFLQMPRGRGDDLSPEAAALRDKAAGLLASGFENVRKSGKPSAPAAAGGLYLVQHLLGQGDAKGALAVLQDESVGPLTLVEAKAPVASEPRFVMEIYKTALRAYLSTEPPDREQARKMMAALDAASAKLGDEGAAQLTRVYASLGLQLQRQLKQLTSTGQDARAAEVAAAFRDVMDRVAAQPGGGNWTIAKWVADTNLQLGQGLEGDEARPYLDRAKTAYQTVLAAAKEGGAGAPDADAALMAHKRLGDCLIALGEFKPAIDEYAAALRAKPMMLDVQQAAAAGLQQWGVAKRVPKAFDEAIQGALPKDGKHLIWGWAKLAQVAEGARRQAAQAAATKPEMAERAARYEDVFFDAHYNIAKARFQAAGVSAPAERKNHLTKAKQNIEAMKQLFPDLGGPTWKAQFEKLLIDINKELEK